MFPIEHVDYSPVLRGKSGEFQALDRLRDQIKDRVAPTIVLPSLSIKDLEKRRRLNSREAPRLFVERMAACWKDRPFFFDARFLVFNHDPVEDRTLLKAMLMLCEQYG